VQTSKLADLVYNNMQACKFRNTISNYLYKITLGYIDFILNQIHRPNINIHVW